MAVKTIDTDLSVVGVVSQSGTPADPEDLVTVEYVEVALLTKVDGENGVTAVWAGTQTEYDAIGTKSATTIYNIHED